MIINPYDSERVIELKNKINKAYKEQRKLAEKYKSVSQYRKLQQDIGLMGMEIEEIYDEENKASYE